MFGLGRVGLLDKSIMSMRRCYGIRPVLPTCNGRNSTYVSICPVLYRCSMSGSEFVCRANLTFGVKSSTGNRPGRVSLHPEDGLAGSSFCVPGTPNALS